MTLKGIHQGTNTHTGYVEHELSEGDERCPRCGARLASRITKVSAKDLKTRQQIGRNQMKHLVCRGCGAEFYVKDWQPKPGVAYTHKEHTDG